MDLWIKPFAFLRGARNLSSRRIVRSCRNHPAAALRLSTLNCHFLSRSRHSKPWRPASCTSKRHLSSTCEESRVPAKLTVGQLSLSIKHPSLVTKQDVLDQLRDVLREHKNGGTWPYFHSSDFAPMAFVVLASPKFALWLEDEAFLEQILRMLEASHGEGLKEVDLLCACVDGIAPEAHLMASAAGNPSIQGFSFLQAPTKQILSGLWADTDSQTTNSSSSMLSSLQFTDERRSKQITLPLANTLFHNGRSSTLIISKWRAQESGEFTRVSIKEKGSQSISILDSESEGLPHALINVVPLTPPRRIVSGLGNIVRQLEYDGQAGPASQELEENVNKYLQLRDDGEKVKSSVGVWALVIPEGSFKEALRNDLKDLVKRDVLTLGWENDSSNRYLVQRWINRGSTFCRVLSGGGGWGAKQGLLSLDPQTTYTESPGARFDFSPGSMEEQQTSALGSVASPNAYIQFFVAASTASSPPMEPISESSCRQSVVIGAVPSTIDDLQQEEDVKGTKAENLTWMSGHFGAVTETGLFFNSNLAGSSVVNGHGEEKAPLQSKVKIDFPHSYILEGRGKL